MVVPGYSIITIACGSSANITKKFAGIPVSCPSFVDCFRFSRWNSWDWDSKWLEYFSRRRGERSRIAIPTWRSLEFCRILKKYEILIFEDLSTWNVMIKIWVFANWLFLATAWESEWFCWFGIREDYCNLASIAIGVPVIQTAPIQSSSVMIWYPILWYPLNSRKNTLEPSGKNLREYFYV